MTIQEICEKAEHIAKEYNPNNLSPFPYDSIANRNSDLRIYLTLLKEDISGAIRFNQTNKLYEILINNTKPQTRQNFTIAHELGHYFLHQPQIKSEQILIDGDAFVDGVTNILYRLDNAAHTEIEREANNFAASLIMPEQLVRKAWLALRSIESCANIFNVSTTAMSIRLERLGLTQ
jgi:Zn-dependent peptidase ImmA (M78 family)